jgi:hypothetical protein
MPPHRKAVYRCTLYHMRSLLFIICIVTFTNCSNKEPVTFDTTTRRIFFNGDVYKNDRELVEFYKSSKYLSLDRPPKGYTLYPPLSALGQDGRQQQYTFRFRTHPYVSFSFREGELIISSRKSNDGEVFSFPTLKFIFDSKEQSELAYNKLLDTYSKLSTRKRFSSYKDTKNAEFTDDNSKEIKEVSFLQGKGDTLANGYVIVFGLGNDLDNDKE